MDLHFQNQMKNSEWRHIQRLEEDGQKTDKKTQVLAKKRAVLRPWKQPRVVRQNHEKKWGLKSIMRLCHRRQISPRAKRKTNINDTMLVIFGCANLFNFHKCGLGILTTDMYMEKLRLRKVNNLSHK